MKYLLFAFLIFESLAAKSQSGYRQLLVSGGLSASNSKLFSIQVEGAGIHKIHAGILFQTLCYSKNENLHISRRWNKTFESAGFYLKGDMYTAKNFCATWFIGGAAGTDTHDIIFYPVGGFEQGWFIHPKTQLFISENVLYLRNIDLKNLWQPNLQAGFKYAL